MIKVGWPRTVCPRPFVIPSECRLPVIPDGLDWASGHRRSTLAFLFLILRLLRHVVRRLVAGEVVRRGMFAESMRKAPIAVNPILAWRA